MRRHRTHQWAFLIPIVVAGLVGFGGDVAPARALAFTPGGELGRAAGRRAQQQRLVVQVVAFGCSGLSAGSGVLAPDGRVLTNRHVVAGADYVEIRRSDGTRIGARVEQVGADLDLAALWIGDVPDAPTAPVGRLDPGEHLVVGGYPHNQPFTLSSGPVTARYRFDVPGMRADTAFVDAEVDVGNSGGPAFDATNHVVGIVVAREQHTGLAAVIDGDTAARFLAGLEAIGDPSACEPDTA